MRSVVVAVFGLFVSGVACRAPTARVGTTELTSSALETSYRESEAAAGDLVRGQPTRALARAEHAALLAPENAWARYDRAVALRQLGSTDAAVAEFREAEARFGGADAHGKAISIYGRARALDDIGRCDEARAAYEEFARFTSSFDPVASALALTYANECRAGEPVVADPAMNEVVTSIIGHEYERALEASERVGKPARASGWLDYNRAIALAGMGRVDDAVAAYRAAESRFATTDPPRRAMAIYGRARVLDQAGRCADAKRAYGEYSRLASPTDSSMAEKISGACGGPPAP